MTITDAAYLDERLRGLDLAPLPVWVLDPEVMRIAWANGPALDMWRAHSREELAGRDFRVGPETVLTRLYTAIARVREGHSWWDEWTVYPRGQPVQIKVHFSPLPLADGRIVVLQHVVPRDEGPAPDQLRGVQALVLTPMIVAQAEFDGRIVMKNPAAILAFGRLADHWPAWFVEPAAAEAMLAAAAAGDSVRREVRVTTEAGERVHVVEVCPARDAVTGRMMALIHHADETARHGAEVEAARHQRLAEELDRTLALVDHQRREILGLSAPLLDIDDHTLAIPLVGAFDRERGADLEARVLPAIAERRVHTVLLDLTGTLAGDVANAEQLMRFVRAIRLLGARAILTGIRPALARALVEVGFDGGETPFARSLAAGLELARAR
ncbi:PAS domain-containing protein [Nannocystis bainbridge]|uniref:PAS domain-containing protein n=1 Tax=Nannocystis bainbridge TaxID=2995303 RepID=A0ABT5E401_9BACT|nr:PAS domain-containing protein [Nannocystis bainbridge]MDC0720163.1 PAS domain-containing protein [Nannocystis bainbridge]